MALPSATIVKWTPFQLACRLHCLRQGSLNVGNTAQNVANLKALAITEANTGGAGAWARWRTGNNINTSNTTNLLLWVPAVPGYLAPAGTANAR